MMVRRVLGSVYRRLPLQWQPPRAARAFLRFGEELQWCSPPEIRAHQLGRIRALLRHAAKNVPYYTRCFEQAGFHPDDLPSLEGLACLPLIDKGTVRANRQALVALDVKQWKPVVRTTGGSTGEHLEVLMSEAGQQSHHADRIRHYRWAGYEMGQRAALLWRSWERMNTKAACVYHRPRNWLYLNGNLFNSETLAMMTARLAAFRPAALLATPSHLYWLYQHLSEHGVDTIRPRTLITSSEMLYDFQRQEIERFFGASISDYYSMAEHAASAGQCEAGSYHVSADYTYVEVVRPDGSPAAPGEIGEIVGTNFENYAMPLIRYRTGDLGALSGESCPCGRSFPVLREIAGRTQDLIVTPDGLTVLIPRRLSFHEVPAVKELQIIQEKIHQFRVKVVPTPAYRDEDGLRIAEILKYGIEFPISVTVEPVDAIPRTVRGKFRLVQCQVPAPLWTGAVPAVGGDQAPGGAESPNAG